MLTAEPSEGPIGFWIRKELQHGTALSSDSIQLLFSADRAWHVQEVIQPALAAGKWVICDRYASSTVAYGEALGIDPTWLANVNAVFPKPDLELFLLPPLDIAMERLERRDVKDIFEKRELQEKVHRAYARIAKEHPAIHLCDSAGEKDATAEAIWRSVQALGL